MPRWVASLGYSPVSGAIGIGKGNKPGNKLCTCKPRPSIHAAFKQRFESLRDKLLERRRGASKIFRTVDRLMAIRLAGSRAISTSVHP